MGQQGLKPLTYAFKQIQFSELNQLMQQYNHESDEFRAALESGLIYLGTFGMDDRIRDHIQDPIHLIRYGYSDRESEAKDTNQVNVRMITGDHLETAKYVAKCCGIVTEAELLQENIALTGEDFRKAVGGYAKVWDAPNNCFRVDF